MASQIQFCVNHVVANTDPDGRAGCALAFGEICTHVGGLATGPVLKTIIDVLMSLSADPHPLVHFWALRALSQVMVAASLTYAPYVNGTLSMITRLYLQDTHEPEGGSLGSINIRGDLPAMYAFCKIVDGVIGVLGPDVQDSDAARGMILALVGEFSSETDESVKVEASRAMQQFLIFGQDFVDLPELVRSLRTQLSSTSRLVKLATIDSVYQLVQRNVTLISRLGGDRLVADLFALLDDDPSIEGVREAITSWLKQTAAQNPSGWIDLCQRIMSKTTATRQTQQKADVGVAAGGPFSFADEESQGLGLDTAGQGGGAGVSSSRWRTQLFALQCLHQIFLTCAQSGRPEHFDVAAIRRLGLDKRGLLISRVGDLIKMAFTASTAQTMEIRLEGLVVLRDVITVSPIDCFVDRENANMMHSLLLRTSVLQGFAGS